jgi:hypothetical protein
MNNMPNFPKNNAAPMAGGMITVGTKAQVLHGTAKRTAGGLTKNDLVLNKRGKIVSRKQQAAGKKAYSRLVKAGYKPKKGVFRLFSKKSKKQGGARRTRRNFW